MMQGCGDGVGSLSRTASSWTRALRPQDAARPTLFWDLLHYVFWDPHARGLDRRCARTQAPFRAPGIVRRMEVAPGAPSDARDGRMSQLGALPADSGWEPWDTAAQRSGVHTHAASAYPRPQPSPRRASWTSEAHRLRSQRCRS
ncbi:hypothetical protein C2E23DRAFT_472180 [Lenzites betulinus]|nr:hypothetical protein C2E23DRAFT_472180 [Lenzites betulinus]